MEERRGGTACGEVEHRGESRMEEVEEDGGNCWSPYRGYVIGMDERSVEVEEKEAVRD